MKDKNIFGHFVWLKNISEWILIPTIVLKFWKDQYFTKSSWTISIKWLKAEIIFGHLKLKEE